MSVPTHPLQFPLFPVEKVCARCKVAQPLSAFRRAGKTSRAKDGLQSYCKACSRQYQREHRPKGCVIDPPPLKRCSACKVYKPSAQFRHDRSSKDGLSHRCRDCGRKRDNERYRRSDAHAYPTSTLGRNKRLVKQGLKICCQCKEVKPLDQFYTSTTEAYGIRAQCKECTRANTKERYRKNVEKVKAYDKARYPLIKERVRERRKRWQAANPEKARAQWQRKRMRRRSAAGRFTAHDIRRLLDEQAGLCYYCGRPYGERWHVEHKIPVGRGGSHWPDNLCIACVPCNQRKHTATEEEFMRILAMP